MNILQRGLRALGGFFSRTSVSSTGYSVASGFSGGRISRLTNDWVTSPVTIDNTIWRDLLRLQARSRDLILNSSVGQRWIQLCKANIIGKGIKLQMKAQKDDSDELDTLANTKIEEAWLMFSKDCMVDGRTTMQQFQREAVASYKTDGECIIQKVRNFPNRAGYALKFIDPERLDVNLNRGRTKTSNEIRLGVEIDRNHRPLAYHFKRQDEGVSTVYTGGNAYSDGSHDVVPASEIIHFYRRDRVNQTRGYPQMAAVMSDIKQLDGYKEAELIAARVAASKMGFYISPDGKGYTGEQDSSDGNSLLMDAEPGAFEELPEGVRFESYDPQHPTTAFADFIKSNKKDISVALGVSYPTLSGDLEGVNYSSIRAGVLEERDQYIMDQEDFADSVLTPIFLDWLPIQILNGNIALPFRKIEKFSNPTWQARRWPWVDPSKDVDAAIKALDKQLTSRSAIMAGTGQDREDVFKQIKQDEISAEKAGIKLSGNATATNQNIEEPEDEN